ncbi:MAG: phosphoglucomutase [Ignavibacteria bacterium]|jgi:phosphomannomutase|nr:phosphoglucomutase [Ignavibacteria bacterium]MCU7504693.1 phosphoglucomutase [Ignavibacteria bacterium]MCU7516295.1 phosphoglucomutase [Ignavibacteria bacterium]
MNNGIIFGTDGWRALLDTEINCQSVALVAQAFANYLSPEIHAFKTQENKGKGIRVAVGFDGRRCSEEFATAFSEVLSGNSITAFLSDRIVPTPALSFFVKANNLDAGVMITASHNPPEYNGIKFKASYGGPFFTEETLKVEKLLGMQPVKKNRDNVVKTDIMETYFRQLEAYIDFEAIRHAGIRILVDSMAGAGKTYLEEILKRNGCSAGTIFSAPSPEFLGRLPEPIEKNLEETKKYLKENPGFSFGIANDGDADRCGVLLEDGRYLSAQYTILLLNDYFVNMRKTKGHLVKTSSVTDKIKLFETVDRKVIDVQVGFKYICEEMTCNDIAVGCEESGGFGYKGHIPERDGILSALIMAEMLAKSGYGTLSRYFEKKRLEFGSIYYDRIDFRYENEDRTGILPGLFSRPPKKITGFSVLNAKEFYSSRGIVNGLKFTLEGNSRWLLLRSSETEPLVRIYAEANSTAEVEEILKAGIGLLFNR